MALSLDKIGQPSSNHAGPGTWRSPALTDLSRQAEAAAQALARFNPSASLGGVAKFTQSLGSAASAINTVSAAAQSMAAAAAEFSRVGSLPRSLPAPAATAPVAPPAPATGTDLAKVTNQAESMGRELSAALMMGLAPLNKMGATLVFQLDTVGGSMIKMLSRIHAKMTESDSTKWYKETADGLRDAAQAAAQSTQPLTRMQTAALRFGPAAASLLRFANWVMVTRNSLDTLRSPIGSLERIGPAANGSSPGIRLLASSVTNLGTAMVKAVPGSKVLATGLSAVGKAAGGSNSSLKGFIGQLAVAAGLTGAAYMVVDFFQGAISSASDLNETVAKTGEVFKGSTDSVIKAAKRQADAFGLSVREQLDAASAFGLIAKGAGVAIPQAAKLSNNMARLAADASSFYNIPYDVVLEKMRSGMVGEAEPMRALGVLLSETAVKTEALRLGVSSSSKELTESAKVIARVSLMEQGLATASGDLVRTQDSLANRIREIKGRFEALAISVGQALLPAIQSMSGLLATVVRDLNRMVSGSTVFDTWGGYLKTAADYAGTLYRNIDRVKDVGMLLFADAGENLMIGLKALRDNLGEIARYFGQTIGHAVASSLGENMLKFARFVPQIALAEKLGAFSATEAPKPPELKMPEYKINPKIFKTIDAIAGNETLNKIQSRAGQITQTLAAVGLGFIDASRGANRFREAVDKQGLEALNGAARFDAARANLAKPAVDKHLAAQRSVIDTLRAPERQINTAVAAFANAVNLGSGNLAGAIGEAAVGVQTRAKAVLNQTKKVSKDLMADPKTLTLAAAKRFGGFGMQALADSQRAADAVKAPTRMAGLAEAGSKEAFNAIANFRASSKGEKAINDVAKNTRKTADGIDKLVEMGRAPAKGGGPALKRGPRI